MLASGDQRRAEQGLHEALDRLEGRIGDTALGDPLVPLAEALNWLYSLEEWHRQQLNNVGVPDYYARRDSDPDGQVVAGVIYTRGLVAHQLAIVGVLVVGVFPSVFPSVFPGGQEWRWRPFTELPTPGKKELHGRDERYKQDVQRQPVMTTLRAAERFFTSTVPCYYP